MVLKLNEVLNNFDESIRQMIISRPDLTYVQIGALHGVTYMKVITVAKKFRLKRPRGPRKQAV